MASAKYNTRSITSAINVDSDNILSSKNNVYQIDISELEIEINTLSVYYNNNVSDMHRCLYSLVSVIDNNEQLHGNESKPYTYKEYINVNIRRKINLESPTKKYNNKIDMLRTISDNIYLSKRKVNVHLDNDVIDSFIISTKSNIYKTIYKEYKKKQNGQKYAINKKHILSTIKYADIYGCHDINSCCELLNKYKHCKYGVYFNMLELDINNACMVSHNVVFNSDFNLLSLNLQGDKLHYSEYVSTNGYNYNHILYLKHIAQLNKIKLDYVITNIEHVCIIPGFTTQGNTIYTSNFDKYRISMKIYATNNIITDPNYQFIKSLLIEYEHLWNGINSQTLDKSIKLIIDSLNISNSIDDNSINSSDSDDSIIEDTESNDEFEYLEKEENETLSSLSTLNDKFINIYNIHNWCNTDRLKLDVSEIHLQEDKTVQNFTKSDLSSYINLDLFDYQVDNINFMHYIEATKPEITNPWNLYFMKLKYDINYKVKRISVKKTLNEQQDIVVRLASEHTLTYNIPMRYYEINKTKYINYHKYQLTYEIFPNETINKSGSTVVTYHKDVIENKIVSCNDVYTSDNDAEFKNTFLTMNGGIIADDVGLGKTLSTITYLAYMRNTDRAIVENNAADLGTLIILPNRLVTQWENEIKKYLKTKNYLRVCKIGTLTDVKKKLAANLSDLKSKYDIFLIANTLFGNDKYINGYVTANPVDNAPTNGLNIFNIKWNRIIIDEAHEILISPKNFNYRSAYDNVLKADILYRNNYKRLGYNDLMPSNSRYNISKSMRNIVNNVMFNLKSNNRWCLTATPYLNNRDNMYAYLYWLSDFNLDSVLEVCNSDIPTGYATNGEVSDFIRNPYQADINKFELLNVFNNYISYNTVNEFNKLFVTKHYKSLIKEELGIPELTEDIVYITQSTIEKNIYDSIINGLLRAGRYSGYNSSNTTNKEFYRHLLLKLCSNLLISNLFSENTNYQEPSSAQLREIIDNIELKSLDDINKAFITKLSVKLSETQTFINENTNKYTELNKVLKLIDNIKNYYDKLNIEKYKSLIYNASVNILPNITHDTINDELKHVINKLQTGIKSFIMKSSLNNIQKYIYSNDALFAMEIISDYIDNININTAFSSLESSNKCNMDLLRSFISINQESLMDYKYIEITAILYELIQKLNTSKKASIRNIKNSIKELKYLEERYINQIKVMDEEEFIKEKVSGSCIICWENYTDDTEIIVTKCRHMTCADCFTELMKNSATTTCPECRAELTINDINKMKIRPPTPEISDVEEDNTILNNDTQEIIEKEQLEFNECVNKYGTKMATMIRYIQRIFAADENNIIAGEEQERIIIFSQYDEMLKLTSIVLTDYNIGHVFCKGNVSQVSKNIQKFKTDSSYRIILLSSDKANSGSNLTEARYVFLIDVIDMTKKKIIDIETQAIGRSVRLGQKKSVKVVRFITRNTIEEEIFNNNRYDLLSID